MDQQRRWFWPLVALGTAFIASASALASLALVNPVERASFENQTGTVEELLDCFSLRDPEPFGASDTVLLIAAGICLAAAVVAYLVAVPRR